MLRAILFCGFLLVAACKEVSTRYTDGRYPAEVSYYNPATDYRATYDLTVLVEQGEVTVIYFPKGGWLDESHITPRELNMMGQTTIKGEAGKTYRIQLVD